MLFEEPLKSLIFYPPHVITADKSGKVTLSASPSSSNIAG
jgi:hypothetical protein